MKIRDNRKSTEPVQLTVEKVPQGSVFSGCWNGGSARFYLRATDAIVDLQSHHVFVRSTGMLPTMTDVKVVEAELVIS